MAIDWKEIEENLGSQYHRVYLNADGYAVSIGLERVSKLALAYTVSVDGWLLRGEWLAYEASPTDAPEVSQKFYRATKQQLHSTKWQNAYVKAFGKREATKRGVFDSRYLFRPDWYSAKSLIRHLKKTCTEIEQLDYERYQVLVDSRHSLYQEADNARRQA